MSRSTTKIKPAIDAAAGKLPLAMRHVGYGPSGIAAYVVEDARGRQIKHPRTVISLFTYDEANELVTATNTPAA
jgi:hypothetical protein